jgi:hypothetical protein
VSYTIVTDGVRSANRARRSELIMDAEDMKIVVRESLVEMGFAFSPSIGGFVHKRDESLCVYLFDGCEVHYMGYGKLLHLNSYDNSFDLVSALIKGVRGQYEYMSSFNFKKISLSREGGSYI